MTKKKDVKTTEVNQTEQFEQLEQQVMQLKTQLQQAIQLVNQKDQQLSGLKVRVFDAEEQVKSNEHNIQHFLNEVGALLGKQVTLQDVYDFIFSVLNEKSKQEDSFEPTEDHEVNIEE